MYSNKYPGPGPAPPLLDNNLAINTAQGAGGHQGRCPAVARLLTALHGVGPRASPRSQNHGPHSSGSQGTPSSLPLASALTRADRG